LAKVFLLPNSNGCCGSWMEDVIYKRKLENKIFKQCREKRNEN